MKHALLALVLTGCAAVNQNTAQTALKAAECVLRESAREPAEIALICGVEVAQAERLLSEHRAAARRELPGLCGGR